MGVIKIVSFLLLASLLSGSDGKVAVHVIESNGRHLIARTYVAPTMGLELLHGKAEAEDVLYCKQLEIHRDNNIFVGLECKDGVLLELKSLYF